MKLDHFLAGGTICFVVDPTTLAPESPSKTNPAQAKKKKGGDLTGTISRKQKRGRKRKRMTWYQPH